MKQRPFEAHIVFSQSLTGTVCIRHLRAAMLLLLCTLVISFAIPFSECQIQNRMLPGVMVKQSNWEGFLGLVSL